MASDYGVIAALIVFIVASAVLGILAQRAVSKGAFMKGYFLGNRGLGAWAMALTATVQSGGTFMGFPSLVYTYGWIVALWIASYMVVPLTGFAFLGKRLAHLSRRTGALTVPDLFAERYASPALRVATSLLIIVFMGFMLVAQFKAGALVMQLAWPGNDQLAAVAAKDDPVTAPVPATVVAAEAEAAPANPWLDPFRVGLLVFSVTVVGYTLFGGFLASVWTDMFQSVMMLVGIVVLLFLALPEAGGLEQATRTAIENTGPAYAQGPGYSVDGRSFLPLGIAVSFFLFWPLSGIGSPAGMVRLMAAERTEVIRRSIILLSLYNCLIYIPLIMICIAGRAMIPDLPAVQSDSIIPRLALKLTGDMPGGSFIGGLILAAPFGAVMATVSCYLVVIASGLVNDLYHRIFRRNAGNGELRMVTYLAMIAVGAVAVAANLNPPTFLQALVVFSGASTASTLVAPAIMACFWRRSTAAGALAAMIAGSLTTALLYGAGWLQNNYAALTSDPASGILGTLAQIVGPDPGIGLAGQFRPYYLFDLDPIVWGVVISSVVGVVVSYMTTPPEQETIDRCFAPQA